MSTQKWWQDNDRYIENPWTEITLLHDELKQMSITEAGLREFLTGLSRESNEYRHKIETENSELKRYVEYIERYADEDVVNAARKASQS